MGGRFARVARSLPLRQNPLPLQLPTERAVASRLAVRLGRPWGGVKVKGSLIEKDYFFFRHSHGGTG